MELSENYLQLPTGLRIRTVSQTAFVMSSSWYFLTIVLGPSLIGKSSTTISQIHATMFRRGSPQIMIKDTWRGLWKAFQFLKGNTHQEVKESQL